MRLQHVFTPCWPVGGVMVPGLRAGAFLHLPKLMDPKAPSRGDINCETIGQDATLYFFYSATHNFCIEGRQIFAVNVPFQH